jgi:hypothetical protein
MPLQPGKTITKNGKTYILNEHHRWTLKDHHEAQQRRAAGPKQQQLFETKGDPNQRMLFKTDDAVPDDMVAKPQGGQPAKPMPKFDPATGLKMPGAGTGTSPGYDGKVRNLEKQGMTTSDAQGVADMEELRNDPNSPIGKPKAPAPTAQPPKPTANLGERSKMARFTDKSAPKPDRPIKGNADRDSNHDGIADQARVGVGAFDVPPPPKAIKRLPGLSPRAKKAEEAFASWFEADADEATEQALVLYTAPRDDGGPPTFETDAAKTLSPYWDSPALNKNLAMRSKNRATYNTALHQTANAICKRAFVQHLDTLNPGDEILVTVGGCGAGKGYSQEKNKETGEPNCAPAAELLKRAAVVWDSAGDQNATENPWILQEARKRGLKVAFLYVHADPKTQWADPKRGVVQRAMNQNNGRMVDAKVFADSYALGAQNHASFLSRHAMDPDVTSLVVKNGNPPEVLQGMPEEALNIDPGELYRYAKSVIEQRTDLPDHVREGAMGGSKIWEDYES